MLDMRAKPGIATVWLLIFAAGLAAILIFRIVFLALNQTDLFFDEAQYWSWSQTLDFGYYSKPPLIAWIVRAATEVCGPTEFCVRLASPIIHALTAVIIFLIGRKLYDARVGAVAGLMFATLPGVSLSSGIISTDVPLLLAWATALLAIAALFESRSWWPVPLLGLALGLGANAKYAMTWFGICLAIYLALTPSRRFLLRDARLYVAIFIGALLLAPNLAWNATNGFATFRHTADNANWQGPLFNPLKALEFFGAQFGVFGPILFAGLLVIAWRSARTRLPEADRLMLCFALPVIAAITLQAMISRAHANWAAAAYVPASVLLAATMLRLAEHRWLSASFVLHVGAALLIGGATAMAGRVALPFGDPLARTLGWEAIAMATRAELEAARASGRPFAAVVTDQRAVTAELLYYMREEPTPVVAWRAPGPPQDHFEMTRPFDPKIGEPVLLVGLKDVSAVTAAFATVDKLRAALVPAGPSSSRTVTFFALSGFRGS